MQPITDLSLAQLGERFSELGLKPYAAMQVAGWLYQKRAASFEAMSNLSLSAREILKKNFSLGSVKVADLQHSADGTCLFLFELSDGKKVEAVYIPSHQVPSTKYYRTTLCLSTQVGCALACTFCRTGQMNLMRNLTQGEILEQVLAIQNCFPGEKITNLVFMGMGEPMANLKALLPALEILHHDQLCAFSKRRITVSTAGLVPKMYEFIEHSSVKLAVSLHAPNEALRNSLMPINARYPLRDLMQFCRDYKKRFRFRITFEYVMLKGMNDSQALAHELVRLLQGIPSKMNLIPFNPFPTVDYQPSDDVTLKAWVDILMKAGIQTNVRLNRGRDILAACGQLAA